MADRVATGMGADSTKGRENSTQLDLFGGVNPA